MRPSRASIAAAVLAFALCGASPALARDVRVSIPATTLDAALNTLAREAGAEIVSTEPGLRTVRTRGVQGSMSVRKALALLLDGTGYRAVPIAGGGYRIVRGAVAPPPRRPRPTPAPTNPVPPQTIADIIVTANKQRVPLLRYPGSLTIVEGVPSLKLPAAGDMTEMARTIPVLQGTQLGTGRNKVFIRGVADSSFNGATQSPASTYLDDVQLNYSGPDPGLRLYDMRSVEVLEGPQGTLYGSGAIGGVIRLSSNAVDLDDVAGSAAEGVTLTEGGAAGGDLAGMINLPIERGRIGLRAVAYGVRDGGYIDDVRRGLTNVNRTDTVGGRLALRFDPGNDWMVETSGAMQNIRTRDGQYAEQAEDRLSRRSLISQPFENDLFFGRVAITKEWSSGLRLFSATGIVIYGSTDRFDATPPPASGADPIPATYRSDRQKRLLSQEIRLSRSLPNGNSWVGGLTLVRDIDILSREVESPNTSASIIGVTNVTKAASAFGEATFALARTFSVTVGARATTARVDGQPSSTPRSADYVKGRSSLRLDPTIGASWLVARRIALFARYQTGYRTGGLAVAAGVGRVNDYRSDAITVSEVGVRTMRSGETGLALSTSFSLTKWTAIQADLISRRGQPYTTNIGDARIRTVEGTIDWIPIVGLRADASFLFTNNRVTGPLADLSQRSNRRLPETPPFAGHAGIAYQWSMDRVQPSLSITADYVGRSVLGTGDLLDISQGNYTTFGASGQVRWGKVVVSLTADNLTDRAANRFAFGNPFSLVSRNQTTPLRPRNIRIGVSTAW